MDLEQALARITELEAAVEAAKGEAGGVAKERDLLVAEAANLKTAAETHQGQAEQYRETLVSVYQSRRVDRLIDPDLAAIVPKVELDAAGHETPDSAKAFDAWRQAKTHLYQPVAPVVPAAPKPTDTPVLSPRGDQRTLADFRELRTKNPQEWARPETQAAYIAACREADKRPVK